MTAPIGFSTGALRLGDFIAALHLFRGTTINAIELSALRLRELPNLIKSLHDLDLEQFEYVAVHAPSNFSSDEEDGVIELLKNVPSNWPIIVHPDTVHSHTKWFEFGSQLTIENMDRRKADGRTAEELAVWFDRLPSARLCFDMAHAHQCDRTMTEAFRILAQNKERLRQLHISELDSAGHHYPLSFGSIRAFSEVAFLIPSTIPIIIESLSPLQNASEEEQKAWIEREAGRASEALGRESLASVSKSIGAPATLSSSNVSV